MNNEAKGNYGWLDLQRMTLPFTTMNRFFPENGRESSATIVSKRLTVKPSSPKSRTDLGRTFERGGESPKQGFKGAPEQLEDYLVKAEA